MEKFRKAAEDTAPETFPGMEAVWSRVAQRLDAERGGRVIPLRKVAAAAAVLLLPLLGLIAYLEYGRPIPPATVATRNERGPAPEAPAEPQGPAEDNRSRPLVTRQGPVLASAVPASRRDNDRKTGIYPEAPSQAAVPSAVMPASPGSRLLTGTITDEGGAAIPGALVSLKGTPHKAVTDAAGNYELRIPGDTASGVLIVDVPSAGAEEVAVTDAAGPVNIAIAVPDEPQAVHTMVYSTAPARARATTGEADSAGGLAILDSHVPGIRIFKEGSSSGAVHSGSNTGAPLIVVDGRIYDHSLSRINPADIESIDLLKQAAAISRYGARGNNGVIWIKTKARRAEEKGADSTSFFKKIHKVFSRD